MVGAALCTKRGPRWFRGKVVAALEALRFNVCARGRCCICTTLCVATVARARPLGPRAPILLTCAAQRSSAGRFRRSAPCRRAA
eukprot:15118-Alexandrium_andersonii.AAC.1